MCERIITALKRAKHVLVVTHHNPDGDAIGALGGIGHICSFLSVPYTLLLETHPKKLCYITEGLNISDKFTENFDTFVSVDCGDVYRFEKYIHYYDSAQVTINIDHHQTNNLFADINYVEADASSASELVYNLAKACNMPTTVDFAKAIYTGVVSDTGGFMYPATKPSTHRVAAELISLNFDFTSIYHSLVHLKSEKTITLETIAMNRLVKLNNKGFFLTYITKQDLNSVEADKDDISGIVSYIKNIEGCNMAVFIYEEAYNKYKVSLRSNEPYDVASIAQSFSGGGHKRAAGATIDGSLEQVVDILKQKLIL